MFKQMKKLILAKQQSMQNRLIIDIDATQTLRTQERPVLEASSSLEPQSDYIRLLFHLLQYFNSSSSEARSDADQLAQLYQPALGTYKAVEAASLSEQHDPSSRDFGRKLFEMYLGLVFELQSLYTISNAQVHLLMRSIS
jgi:hypothetical protein